MMAEPVAHSRSTLQVGYCNKSCRWGILEFAELVLK